MQLTRGAGKRVWVACERVRARFYFRLNEKESSEPIKLKVCVTDAKREKTRAKKRRLLFHATYKKVTIGLFLILIGYEENYANFVS